MLRRTYDRNLTSYYAGSQPTPQRILRKRLVIKVLQDKQFNRRPQCLSQTLLNKRNILKRDFKQLSLVFKIRRVRCASKTLFQNARPKTVPFTAQRTGTYTKQHCPMLPISRRLPLVHVSTSVTASMPSNSQVTHCYFTGQLQEAMI